MTRETGAALSTLPMDWFNLQLDFIRKYNQ
jgi:hypothetical protein